MTDVFLLLSGLLTGAVRVLVGLFLVHRLLSIKRPDRKASRRGWPGRWFSRFCCPCSMRRISTEWLWRRF